MNPVQKFLPSSAESSTSTTASSAPLTNTTETTTSSTPKKEGSFRGTGFQLDGGGVSAYMKITIPQVGGPPKNYVFRVYFTSSTTDYDQMEQILKQYTPERIQKLSEEAQELGLGNKFKSIDLKFDANREISKISGVKKKGGTTITFDENYFKERMDQTRVKAKIRQNPKYKGMKDEDLDLLVAGKIANSKKRFATINKMNPALFNKQVTGVAEEKVELTLDNKIETQKKKKRIIETKDERTEVSTKTKKTTAKTEDLAKLEKEDLAKLEKTEKKKPIQDMPADYKQWLNDMDKLVDVDKVDHHYPDLLQKLWQDRQAALRAGKELKIGEGKLPYPIQRFNNQLHELIMMDGLDVKIPGILWDFRKESFR